MTAYKDLLLDTCEPEGCDTDFLEEGSGPPVVLVHSSMAGARQWSTLMPELNTRWNVRAVNLFGYGGTRAWRGAAPPPLDDYATLIASVIPQSAPKIALVGHSLGGAVAMRAAQQLRGRVDRLVLIEPSLFHLLDSCGDPRPCRAHRPAGPRRRSRCGRRAVRRLLVRNRHMERELTRSAKRDHPLDRPSAG